MRRAAAGWLFIASQSLFAAPPESPCDPDLAQETHSPYGYRLRGQLCEGVYARQVASTALLLVSFTSSVEDYGGVSGADLILEWKAPGSGDVRVRARSTQRRLYYGMDAHPPRDTRALRWPAGLLHALNVQSPELGLLAWTHMDSADQAGTLYLPVVLRQKDPANRSSSYQVALLPGVDLSEIYVTVARIGRDGQRGKPNRDGQPLKYGYYPADQRIGFTISNPGSPGIYSLEVGATLKSGGSITLPVLFYHAG